MNALLLFPFFVLNKLRWADLGEKKNLTQLQLIAPFIYPIKHKILIQEVYFLFWVLILLIRTKMLVLHINSAPRNEPLFTPLIIITLSLPRSALVPLLQWLGLIDRRTKGCVGKVSR